MLIAMQIVGRPIRKDKGMLLYKRITTYLRAMIDEGRLRAGDALPPERELSRQLQVSHLTVRKALSVLVDEGLIERHVGRGTYVTEGPRRKPSGASRHRTIAIAVPRSMREFPFVGHSITGARDVLPQASFGVEVLDFGPEGFNDEMLDLLRGRSISGLIYQGFLGSRDVERLRGAGISVVRIGASFEGMNCSCVWFDVSALMTQIIREAYRFGHHSIAQVIWEGSSTEDYATACRAFNLLDSAQRVVALPAATSPEPTCISTEPLFDLEPFPACLVVNDEIMAAAVMRDLEARGYRVPDDVSVVSLLDHAPQAHRIPLTAPDSNADLRKVCRVASQILLDHMDGRQTEAIARIEPVQLHFKASLGPAPGWRVPADTQPANHDDITV